MAGFGTTSRGSNWDERRRPLDDIKPVPRAASSPYAEEEVSGFFESLGLMSPGQNLRRNVQGMSAEQADANERMRSAFGVTGQQAAEGKAPGRMGPPRGIPTGPGDGGKGAAYWMDQHTAPNFDPNQLSDHEQKIVNKAFGKEMVGPPAPTHQEREAAWLNDPGRAPFPHPGAVGADGKLREPPKTHGHDISQGSGRGASGGWPRDRQTGGATGSWGPLVDGKALLKKKANNSGGRKSVTPGDSTAPTVGTPAQKAGVERDPDEDELDDMKQSIRDFANKKTKLDLTPMFGLADAWTGANQQRSYKAPMGEEEKGQILQAMKERVVAKASDIRYKKNYLLAMDEQNKSRERLKVMDLKNRFKIEELRAAGKIKAAAVAAKASDDPEKMWNGLQSQFKASHLFIAEKQFGNPKNPEDKSHKGRQDSVHLDLKARAQKANREGIKDAKGQLFYPTEREAYMMGMQEYMNEPRGKDGAGASGGY